MYKAVPGRQPCQLSPQHPSLGSQMSRHAFPLGSTSRSDWTSSLWRGGSALHSEGSGCWLTTVERCWAPACLACSCSGFPAAISTIRQGELTFSPGIMHFKGVFFSSTSGAAFSTVCHILPITARGILSNSCIKFHIMNVPIFNPWWMDSQFVSGLFCFVFDTKRVLGMHIHESVLSFLKDQFRYQNVCLLIHIHTHVCFEKICTQVDRLTVSDSLQIYPPFPHLLLLKSLYLHTSCKMGIMHT